MYCRLLLIYTRCDWLYWMEDRETARMRKYGESKMTRIIMATVPHVTSGLGLRKFQADGFLLTRVYITGLEYGLWYKRHCLGQCDILWSIYWHFRGARSFQALGWDKQQSPPKHTRLHSTTPKHTVTFIVTSMRTSNLNKYYMSWVGPD